MQVLIIQGQRSSLVLIISDSTHDINIVISVRLQHVPHEANGSQLCPKSSRHNERYLCTHQASLPAHTPTDETNKLHPAIRTRAHQWTSSISSASIFTLLTSFKVDGKSSEVTFSFDFRDFTKTKS